MSTKPDCAVWNVWRGREIEGYDDIGEETLFVRDLKSTTLEYYRSRFPDIRRVWFCSEFWDHSNFLESLQEICRSMRMYRKVCIEVRATSLVRIPEKMMNQEQIALYIKLELPYTPKPGTHICIGTAFSDEAFLFGRGRKVSPDRYSNDIRID
jgi:hypothetical protein